MTTLKKLLIFTLFGLIGTISTFAGEPAVGSIHWIWVQGHYEAIVGSKVIEVDPVKRTWIPHRAGWPSLDLVRKFHSENLWWDGFEVFGTPYGEHNVQVRVLSFFPERGREPAWFARTPVILAKGERVMAANYGKAIVRKDVWSTDDIFASEINVRVKGPGHTKIDLLDLTDGNRTELMRIEGSPLGLQVNATVWNGELYVFTNHGEVWRWVPQQGSPSLITKDFYADAGVELVTSGYWTDWDNGEKIYAQFRAYPCFDSGGRIMLAMEGPVQDAIQDGLALKEKFVKLANDLLKNENINEYQKKQCQKILNYPFKPNTNYVIPASAAILLAFDPIEKKWERLSITTAEDLLKKNPESKSGLFMFKDDDNGMPLVMGADGNFRKFNFQDFKLPSVASSAKEPPAKRSGKPSIDPKSPKPEDKPSGTSPTGTGIQGKGSIPPH